MAKLLIKSAVEFSDRIGVTSREWTGAAAEGTVSWGSATAGDAVSPVARATAWSMVWAVPSRMSLLDVLTSRLRPALVVASGTTAW